MAKLSAINTLLENYPVLTTTDPLLTNVSLNTSVGFMLSILEVFGVTQADIISWLCKLLGTSDGKSDCVLDTIEFAIKGILLLNIKSLFTCTVNPLIPDNLMKYAVQNGRPDPFDPVKDEKQNCIEIKIGDIDLFGLLANCPSHKDGGVFYFDASEPSEEYIGKDGNTYFKPHYAPGELWKSRDFNAFLWYVINKGNIGSPTDTQKNTWDNRVQAYKTYKQDETGKVEENFFKIELNDGVKTWPPISTPNIPIYDVDNYEGVHNLVTHKKQILICQYAEHGNSGSNVLKVWINADRYYKTRIVPFGKKQLAMNRTIFEFNYDYIYSLKLFDTKTLLANIVNSLLGIASSVSVSISLDAQMEIVRKTVEQIVENIIQQDDLEIEDGCYIKFDDTMTYQAMLNNTTNDYDGSYNSLNSEYNPKYDEMFESLRGLDSTAEQEPGTTKKDKIAKAIGTAMETVSNETNGHITLGLDFISNFIKQTVVQIVLQILSPKVAVLYAINSSVMGGDVTNISDWKTFIQNSQNLIIQIVRQVKDIIIKELYNFMMEKLSPILKLFISKLALETVKDYKDLITDLITNCIPTISLPKGTPTIIDNVNYADIVPQQTAPNNNKC